MFALLYIADFSYKYLHNSKNRQPPWISPFASWSRKTHSPAVQTSKLRWKFEEDLLQNWQLELWGSTNQMKTSNGVFFQLSEIGGKTVEVSGHAVPTLIQWTLNLRSLDGGPTEVAIVLYAEWLLIRKTCVVNVLRICLSFSWICKDYILPSFKNFLYFTGFPPNRHSFWSYRCFKGEDRYYTFVLEVHLSLISGDEINPS